MRRRRRSWTRISPLLQRRRCPLVHAWQCTLCGVTARAGVFALWGCGPAQKHGARRVGRYSPNNPYTRAVALPQSDGDHDPTRDLHRPLRPTDAPDLARIAGNDAVALMLASVTSPWPETDVLQWIEQSRWRGRVGFKLGVCLSVARLLARWVWAERPKVLHISWRHRFGGGG